MPGLSGLISHLASDPIQSWKRFKIAVGLFVLAVALILGGYVSLPLLQIPGLIILPVALIFAAWGYAGILCHRLAQFKASTPRGKPSHRSDT